MFKRAQLARFALAVFGIQVLAQIAMKRSDDSWTKIVIVIVISWIITMAILGAAILLAKWIEGKE